MSKLDLRFDAAINPYGCAPSVVATLHEAVAARGYRHYGDPDGGALRARLAAHFNLQPDNFLAYNGCGEGLVWQALTRLLLTRGVFICPRPSYERFVDIGRRAARAVVEVPLGDDSTLPVARFIDEARASNAALAMISSPNNPTGNALLDEDTLVAILSALPACTVVVDEAYAEYRRSSFAPLVARHPNLVVLKTFSKAYGLAGLRVGYLVAHERAIAEARRFQIPWSVDSLALAAAEAALGDQAYLDKVVVQIRFDTLALGRALAALPVARVYPTEANFHLVELQPGGWDRIAPALAARGLSVRRRADMPDHVRITSMLPAANAILLETLEKALGVATDVAVAS